jgi:hypothetical protein
MLGGLAGSALGLHPAVWWSFAVGMFRAAVPDSLSSTREIRALSEMDGPDFRGCPFINAAGELCDPSHPGLTATTEHRTWLRGYLTELAQKAGVRDAADLASTLLMLYDAAMVHGALDHTDGAAAQRARTAAQALLDAAGK